MNSLMAEVIKKTFDNYYYYYYLIIIYSISKIGNVQVVENLFPKKMNRDLLESYHS